MAAVLHSQEQPETYSGRVVLKAFTRGKYNETIVKSLVCHRIDSALLRSGIYGTARLGIYFNTSEYFRE